MGAVYRAHDPQLERDVAIKMLVGAKPAAELSPDDTLDLRGDAPTSDELLREARMMAKLSHPNVLPVYEVGLSDGAVFVVMEHIAGSDLEAWLADKREPAEVLEVFAQAGRGLAAAHARGIVHRDFKPANVLLGSDGRVCVADFGLSRLDGRAATAMIQLDDGRGTPRFMAPELWRGQPATLASDVYAFCAALDRALGGDADAARASDSTTARERGPDGAATARDRRPHEPDAAATRDRRPHDPGSQAARDRRWRERGLPPRVRAVLAAGLSDEPSARPELATVLAAMTGRRRSRTRWLVGGGAAIVAAGGIVGALVFGGSHEPPACTLDHARFSRVRPEQRAKLAELLAKQPASPAITAQRVLALIDGRQHAVETAALDACEAEHAGTLTDAQAAGRGWCLERRAVEVAAVVDRLVAVPRSLADAESLVDEIAGTQTCVETQVPPHAPDPAVFARYIAAFELGVPDKAAEHLSALVAAERVAREAGELEIAARAAYQQSFELRFQDRFDEADAALQRTHRDAIAIKSEIAGDALLERSDLAARRNRAVEARSFAELARDVVDKPSAPPFARARVELALANADYRGSHYKPSAEHYERALQLAESMEPRQPAFELSIRFSLINALIELANTDATRGPAAVRVGRDTVELARRHFGEHDPNYGIALNMAAAAFGAAYDHAGAVDYSRRALANMLETLPASSSHIPAQRADLAAELRLAGDLPEARKEIETALAAGETNEAVRAFQPKDLELQATIVFELGELEHGYAMAERAREALLAQHGATHQETLDAALLLVDMNLELDRVDRADAQLSALDATYASLPRSLSRTMLGLERAQVKVARGKPAAAEQLARDALATVDELNGTDLQRVMLDTVLADSLLGQSRWADARAVADAGLALARKIQSRADTIAALEVRLGRAERGLGVAGGEQRIRRARATLERWPAQGIARRMADAALRR